MDTGYGNVGRIHGCFCRKQTRLNKLLGQIACCIGIVQNFARIQHRFSFPDRRRVTPATFQQHKP